MEYVEFNGSAIIIHDGDLWIGPISKDNRLILDEFGPLTLRESVGETETVILMSANSDDNLDELSRLLPATRSLLETCKAALLREDVARSEVEEDAPTTDTPGEDVQTIDLDEVITMTIKFTDSELKAISQALYTAAEVYGNSANALANTYKWSQTTDAYNRMVDELRNRQGEALSLASRCVGLTSP